MNPGAGPTSEPDSPALRRSPFSVSMTPRIAYAVTTLGRLLALLVSLALVGHFARGRAISLEMLLYFPLLPLGLAAVVVGAVMLSLPTRRQGVRIVTLGIVSILVSGWWMIGRGPERAHLGPNSETVVRLLHWNVLWGGLNPAEGGWVMLVDEIVTRAPDIVVLSEAAPVPLRKSLTERLGAGWTEIAAEAMSGDQSHRYRIVVVSRWPARFGSSPEIRNGIAREVIVDHPSRPIRILTVDGKSRPTIPRSPMLHDIAEICDRAARPNAVSGPIDIVVGDFNCVSRSQGFDELRAADDGYALASEASTGWRATWPSWLPLYDIDHVWVRSTVPIRSCTLFSRFASDHRGQIVELGLQAGAVTDRNPQAEPAPRLR